VSQTDTNYSSYCANQPNGCPSGSSHTANATVAFASSTLRGAANKGLASGTPYTNITARIDDVGFNCDLIFGANYAPQCQFKEGGGVDCSVMGALYSAFYQEGGTFIQNYIGYADTLVKNLSGSAGYNCYNVGPVSLGLTFCTWDVVTNCTNATPWNPTRVTDEIPPGLAGWWSAAVCERLTTASPWVCQGIPGVASFMKTTQSTPAYCHVP
jgi:hypothetical protein